MKDNISVYSASTTPVPTVPFLIVVARPVIIHKYDVLNCLVLRIRISIYCSGLIQFFHCIFFSAANTLLFLFPIFLLLRLLLICILPNFTVTMLYISLLLETGVNLFYCRLVKYFFFCITFRFILQ